MTRQQLDLITDQNMYLMIEQGLRGGISMVSHRFSKANHPYLKDYSKDKPNKYILYLDATNLYGWAMMQYLFADTLKRKKL